MVAFGFMDNFIMIVAGDAIDASIGVKLGVSTMAAAGLGNTLSDCVGLFTGDHVEEMCRRAGVREPKLTEEQAQTREARFAKRGGSLLGLASGCLLGMFPLLWHTDRKPLYFSPEQQDLYEELFRPHGVSLNSFFTLMKGVKWKTCDEGDLLVARGEPLREVVLLVSGSAMATSSGDRPLLYLSHRADAGLAEEDDCTLRGCFLGVAGLLDRTGKTLDKPFPYEVRAASQRLRYISWEAATLHEMMEEDKAIESAMLSILYAELLQSTRRMSASQAAPAADSVGASAPTLSPKAPLRGAAPSKERVASASSPAAHEPSLKMYRVLIEATLADGVVHPAERQFANDFRKRRGITSEDHEQVLKEFGWSLEDWDCSRCDVLTDLAATNRDLIQQIPGLLKSLDIKSRLFQLPAKE